MNKKTVWNDLNPKAISRDELFGFIHPGTREWKDGNIENVCVCVYFIWQFVFYDIEAVDLCSKTMIDSELFRVAGLLSCLMREQAYNSHPGPKWIILDGDVDPLWIESLNTVMDDNKVSLYLLYGFLFSCIIISTNCIYISIIARLDALDALEPRFYQILKVLFSPFSRC